MDVLGLQLAADAASDKAFFDDEGEEHLREVLEWAFLADEGVEELADRCTVSHEESIYM